MAAGSTLTRPDKNSLEPWNVSLFTFLRAYLQPKRKQSKANKCKLLGLAYVLKRFRFYLKVSRLEAISDNQILRNCFTKASLNREEALWLEFLGFFEVSKLTWVKYRVHILDDALTNAPCTPNCHVVLSPINLPQKCYRLSYRHVWFMSMPSRAVCQQNWFHRRTSNDSCHINLCGMMFSI